MPDVRVLNELQIKKNGVVATYRLGTVNGYYNPTDGKFYEEVTHVTEIEGTPNLVYADIAGNALYIYKTATSSFVKVSGEGGGSADNLKFGYLNDEDGKFYEDDQYQVEISGNADYLFIGLDNNTIYRYDTSDTAFVAIGGGESSGGTIEGYYNSEDGKFYQEETFVTEIPGQAGMLYVDLSENKTYRYDESETEFIVVGGGGTEYQAGFGIDIDDDTIKTTDFVGTQAQWDALTATEKAAYDFVHITDDITNVNYSPGHAISDGTSEKTQREILEFNGFDVTDDSINGKTKIAEVPYTAGDGIEITNKEISVGDEISRTWTGTKAEWDAISDKSIYDGWIINITDDAAVGSGPVVDVVEDGNLNAVTSNAVYDALVDKPALIRLSCTKGKTYTITVSNKQSPMLFMNQRYGATTTSNTPGLIYCFGDQRSALLTIQAFVDFSLTRKGDGTFTAQNSGNTNSVLFILTTSYNEIIITEDT